MYCLSLLFLFVLILGDIRLTPFYNILDCVAKVETYVNELNQGICFACMLAAVH